MGLASELDLRRAQTQVDAARGDIARYTQLAAQDENALNLLVGLRCREALLPTDLGSVSPSQRDFSRPVLRGAPEPAGHPGGRTPAQGGQRQYRRGPGRALSPDFADNRLSEPPAASCPGSLNPARTPGISRRRSPCRFLMPACGRPMMPPKWTGNRLGPIREGHPDRLPGSGRRPGRARHGGQAAVGAAIAGGCHGRNLSASPTVRYKKGIDSYLGVLDAQRSLYAAQRVLIALRLETSSTRCSFMRYWAEVPSKVFQ